MSKHKKLDLKAPIGESQTSLRENAPLRHLDRRVRFSFKDCNTKKYCIRKLEDNEITRFYSRLGYFEEHTFQQAINKGREDGFGIEKKESDNFKDFFSAYPNFSTFLHFRVNGTNNPFRVFGAIKDDLCYILSIDGKGKINDH